MARAVARALGFTYLDTGAMYRAVALASLRGLDEVEALDIQFDGDLILLNGEDVSGLIRTPAISEQASVVANDPSVRDALVAQQRTIVAGGDFVAEGRDIATVVAPDAEVKVYLTAHPAERARRRAAELGLDPEDVAAELLSRDERDSSHGRTVLQAAPGAWELDTTGLSIDEVVDAIVARVSEVSA